ncbi:winged helix DNA-binding domain-containing protein, partial [Pengzhenrongella sp.]|uniref:winged helix DNA-binding domain-containing protein n=1 Tax=Pengzhenrongella sp. TaxID=2888820 RepID=UPI002F94041D
MVPRSPDDRSTQVVAERLTAQLLAGPPARSPVDVVRRLLAVQGQDARGARLSVRARSTGLTADDVDRALTDRALVITWLNRGTLHLVAAEDYWWLHALTTPQLVTANARRLGQEGVSPDQTDRGVAVIRAAVRADGPQSRAQLKARLEAAGVPTRGQALVHVLFAASLRGHVLRGPMHDGEHAFVEVRGWLGEPPAPLPREEALARLARRYLAGHGPADARDLSKWAGITLADARRGVGAIGADLRDRGDGLLDLTDRTPPSALPGPRLLGPFDPLLLGWVSREPFVGAHRGVATTNGVIRPVALAGGRVVA